MKRLDIIAALLLACTGAAPAQSSDTTFYTHETLKSANGEAIFHSICQGCHMPDAKGATGAGTYPALAGDPRLVSAQYMAAVVLFGRHDMPSFEMKASNGGGFFRDAKLTDEQVADVVNYVRTHFGNHYSDRMTAAQVAAMHPSEAAKP